MSLSTPHSIEAMSSVSFQEAKALVLSRFTVTDSYVDPQGIPTFTIRSELVKSKFENLVSEMSQKSLVPTLRSEEGNLMVRVFPAPRLKPTRPIINLVLFVATIATVFVTGFVLWEGSVLQREVLMPNSEPYVQVSLFVLSLFAIVGLHEVGHKIACEIHKMDSTMPYFIPGFPPTGTFGAVISLRSPPRNRDALFDLGMSGPMVAFVSLFIVTVLSIQTAYLVPIGDAMLWNKLGLAQPASWPEYPLLFDLLTPIVRSLPKNFVLLFTQTEFAAWIGSLVSYLNLLPIWQLDGGHMSRAVLGTRGHKLTSYIGLAVMIISGFWVFALLLSIMMFLSGRGSSGVVPLDDWSPLSTSRKIFYVFVIIMIIVLFVRL
jgi:membrane-associated protease RseP (regulator of RpoE activity)